MFLFYLTKTKVFLMKKTTSLVPKLSLKKVDIIALGHPQQEGIKGGISGNCPPPSALRTIVRCVQPTTTVQHTFACLD